MEPTVSVGDSESRGDFTTIEQDDVKIHVDPALMDSAEPLQIFLAKWGPIKRLYLTGWTQTSCGW